MIRTTFSANMALLALIVYMAIQFLTSYAVVPGKYPKETYSNNEVHVIVLHERSDGMNHMRSMLEMNMLILILAVIPVSILNIIAIKRYSRLSSG